MTLSVVIFNYNYSRFLNKLFESIKQSFNNTDINIFFCDDGSSDNSIEVFNELVNKYNISNIKLIINKEKDIKREHPAFGQLEGLENVLNNYTEELGEYIVLLDSDDWVEESFFKKLQKEIQSKENLYEIFFNDLRDTNSYENTPKNRQMIKRPIRSIKSKIWPTIVPTSGIVVKKDLLERYKQKLFIKNQEFADVWLDSRINILAINLVDKVKYTEIVAYRYMHGSNDSLKFNLKRKIDKQIQASKYFNFIVEKKLGFNFRKKILEIIHG